MMHRWLSGLLLAAAAWLSLAGGAPSSSGQEGDPKVGEKADDAEAKGMEHWPGKNGLLKAGFRFVPSDYKPLKGWLILTDTREVHRLEDGAEYAFRRVVLGPNANTSGLILEESVLLRSVHDAHQVLAGRPDGQAPTASRRGSSIGLQIGDVNFVDGPVTHKDAEKATGITFVRNNIVVRLEGVEGATVAVVELAREIDAKIKDQPGFTKHQLEALLPSVSTFAPMSATVGRLSSTPVTLSATDPLGLSFEFQFSADIGLLKRDETATPPTTTYYTFGTTGAATLKVWVIDRALLLNSAKASVTVIP